MGLGLACPAIINAFILEAGGAAHPVFVRWNSYSRGAEVWVTGNISSPIMASLPVGHVDFIVDNMWRRRLDYGLHPGPLWD